MTTPTRSEIIANINNEINAEAKAEELMEQEIQVIAEIRNRFLDLIDDICIAKPDNSFDKEKFADYFAPLIISLVNEARDAWWLEKVLPGGKDEINSPFSNRQLKFSDGWNECLAVIKSNYERLKGEGNGN